MQPTELFMATAFSFGIFDWHFMTHFNPLESPYCLAITLSCDAQFFSKPQQHIVFTFSINLTFQRCSSLMSAIAKQKGVGVPSGPVSEQLLIPFPFQHNGGKRGEKLTQNATTIHTVGKMI